MDNRRRRRTLRPGDLTVAQKKQGNAMTKMSKVKSLEIVACDAGWRNYHFVKITTEDGIVGWSEFDEGFGSPGVGAVIQRLSARVIGQNAFQHERWARSKTHCSTPKQNCSACPATNCSAARSAIASGSTGRIAPPGASIIPAGTSRRSTTSMA
jgi:hypothetical protein